MPATCSSIRTPATCSLLRTPATCSLDRTPEVSRRDDTSALRWYRCGGAAWVGLRVFGIVSYPPNSGTCGPEHPARRGGGLEEGRQQKHKEIQPFWRLCCGRSMWGPSGAHVGPTTQPSPPRSARENVMFEAGDRSTGGALRISYDSPHQVWVIGWLFHF